MKDRRDKGLYWDRAWKLVEGCAKVSPGCDNCWSEQETVMRCGHPNEKIRERARAAVHLAQIPGDVTMFDGRIICREDNLDLPLRTKKPTVWAIWNDLYHEDVSDDFRDRAYAVMALCPQHTFLVLTKRSKGMSGYISELIVDRLAKAAVDVWGGKDPDSVWDSVREKTYPLPNVWHGVTAESQEQADGRIPSLLNVPGKRFLSIEPMLGPVDLNQNYNNGLSFKGMVHAVLLGGESGKNARPMHPDWARSVRGQCAAAGVPFYFKQWGEWGIAEWIKSGDRLLSTNHPDYPNRAIGLAANMRKVGKKKAGRTLDGCLHDDLPWDTDQ